jgi:sucrose-6-phosphate hydrolase SacC (GH32 family)
MLRLRGVLLLLAAAVFAADAYRPKIHFSPARNWTNDPCGLYFLDGVYHVFFQYNPFGDTWGHMSWGHASSRDLFHWTEHPVALAEEHGVMMFTGSGVFDKGNTSGLCQNPGGCPVLMYTGHVPKAPRREHQNLAVGDREGTRWIKYAGNPVIDESMEEFRDPKVFWHDATRRWIAVVSLAKEHRVRFYASSDLKSWKRLSEFGPAGALGPNWECPEFFELPVLRAKDDKPRGDTRWVLKIGIGSGHPAGNGSGEQYFVGRFDGETFVNDNPKDITLWFDSGPDCYCTLQWGNQPKGAKSTKMLGWMNNWRYAAKIPTSPFRGQMTVPRDVSLVELTGGQLRLKQVPAAEFARLKSGSLNASRLPATAAFEIQASVAGSKTSESFAVRLENAAGERFEAGFDAAARQWYTDRTQAGRHAFDKTFGIRSTAVPGQGQSMAMRLVVDVSSIELFAEGGTVAMTNLVFPASSWTKASAIGAVKLRIRHLKI